MSLILTWRWQREPERLLRCCGCGSPAAGRREERRFLEALDALPDAGLGDLCIIAGGFLDGLTGRAYCLREELPSVMAGFDVFYREHEEAGDMRRIIARYGRAGRRIALIGHSWGASTLALDVLAPPACRGVPVDALVTLDPVGVRGPRFLPQVRCWLNVYLPYDLAAWSRENNIARLGRPWEQVAQAGLNRVPSQLRHADARGMFREFGAHFLDMVFSFGGFGGRV